MKSFIACLLFSTGLILTSGSISQAQDSLYLSSPEQYAGKLGSAVGSSVLALTPDVFLLGYNDGIRAGGTVKLGRVLDDSLIVFVDSVYFAPAPGPGMVHLLKLSESSFILSFTLNDRIYIRTGEVVDKSLILLGEIRKLESGKVSRFSQVVLSGGHFITAYYDAATEKGTCTLGTVGENLEIEMDSAYLFTDSALPDTSFIAMDALSGSTCVIAYGSSTGKSLLVSVDGERDLTFGTPVTFASNPVHEIHVVGLRENRFVLVYDDESEGKRRGAVVLGTLADTGSISYSGRYFFDLEKPSGLSAIKLLPWEFVISYTGGWNDWNAYLIRARVADDSVSFVNRVMFNPEPALNSLSPLAAFDGQDIIVTYLNRNSYKGYARLASTIEFGRLSSLENASLPVFKIYPNPASDLLHIQWNKQVLISGDISLRLIDMSGRTVLSDRFHGSQIAISLIGVQKGLYLLQLSSEKHMESQKLIVK